MIKRILVLLGETASSAAARSYAYALAQNSKAALTGFAGIDLSSIESPMPGFVGAAAYKTRLEEQLRQQAAEASARATQIFEAECRERGLGFELLSFEGDPKTAACAALETHDIAVAGHDTAFHGNAYEDLSDLLAGLLSDGPRPVIVCADAAPRFERVLIAYDGSVPSMRAVQMYALLGLGQDQSICVASVADGEAAAMRRTSAAASYLRSHGYEPEEFPIVTSANPAEALRIAVLDRKIGTLVMGAYGRRGLKEALFGSTTTELLAQPPCALFVYH
jgi:nucleotide-binding universal stress UspA family protein